MTISEYFNGTYTILKNEEKKAEFFDDMLIHFMEEGADKDCALLKVDAETKPRYVKENKPNPIKADYAKYVSAKRDRGRYIAWISNRIENMDAYEAIENWLKSNGIEFNDAANACYNLLDDIFYKIAFPNNTTDVIELPPQENISDESNTSWLEQDKTLVSAFNEDYDEVIQTCIGDRYAQEWLTGKLPKKIYALHDKWKTKSNEFEDLLLKSDVIAIIGTLQEFCNELNPRTESKPGVSINMIRRKLRNLYVKVHPDGYVGISPYETFIDDWDDGEY